LFSFSWLGFLVSRRKLLLMEWETGPELNALFQSMNGNPHQASPRWAMID
jgi:hypothetical protein